MHAKCGARNYLGPAICSHVDTARTAGRLRTCYGMKTKRVAFLPRRGALQPTASGETLRLGGEYDRMRGGDAFSFGDGQELIRLNVGEGFLVPVRPDDVERHDFSRFGLAKAERERKLALGK